MGVRGCGQTLEEAFVQAALANILYQKIPAGPGSTSGIHLNHKAMNAMLKGGARWAVEPGLCTVRAPLVPLAPATPN